MGEKKIEENGKRKEKKREKGRKSEKRRRKNEKNLKKKNQKGPGSEMISMKYIIPLPPLDTIGLKKIVCFVVYLQCLLNKQINPIYIHYNL